MGQESTEKAETYVIDLVDDNWVPFMRKTTVEQGLIFASQKDEDAKRTTTRTWYMPLPILKMLMNGEIDNETLKMLEGMAKEN